MGMVDEQWVSIGRIGFRNAGLWMKTKNPDLFTTIRSPWLHIEANTKGELIVSNESVPVLEHYTCRDD